MTRIDRVNALNAQMMAVSSSDTLYYSRAFRDVVVKAATGRRWAWITHSAYQPGTLRLEGNTGTRPRFVADGYDSLERAVEVARAYVDRGRVPDNARDFRRAS